MAGEVLCTALVSRKELPSNYVRAESERPKLEEVVKSDSVPVIDLASLDKLKIVQQIRHACSSYGFFQVINHGVSEEAVGGVLQVVDEFFNLPLEEKMKVYSNDPFKTMRLSTSFNVKQEKVNNWRDYLRLHCFPLDHYSPHWPTNPPSLKERVGRYCKEVRELGMKVEEFISESMGLEKTYLRGVVGEQGQQMAINYYPPCPQPELTYGLPAHTDPNSFTILLQDGKVPGLQIFKNGTWIAIDPHPHAFVVNIGDQLQAISNGLYKSVKHRAIVNGERARMSIATFFCPSEEAVIKPVEELVVGGGGGLYRSFTYKEYYLAFWNRCLDQPHCLELFKHPQC